MFFSSNIATHFQGLSVMLIEYRQNVNKKYILDKANSEKNVWGLRKLCGQS